MPDRHSIYGPSAAHKWLNCPGSIAAEAAAAPEKQSSYAAEGNVAHDLAEKSLTEGRPCSDWIGEEVTAEMADYVQEYVDYVKDLGGRQEYEQEVHYDEWVPEGFGTADAIIIKDDTLHVIDLKYGKGVQVYAQENPQGMLYALGALSEREMLQKFETVVIHVVQPRLDHVSSWETAPENLYNWAEWVKERVALTTTPDAQRIPGETQCKFCKAKSTCGALAVRTENTLMTEFDSFANEPVKVETLTDAELRFVLTQKPLIIDWLNAVEAHVKSRIESGEDFSGFKLVHGRSNRKWADEAKAERKLIRLLGKKRAFARKLLTVTQAEKALGKEDKEKIADLIIKPEGALTLVPDEDGRRSIAFVTANDFNFSEQKGN